MSILVTGGTGYIGSHTVLELLTQDHNLVVLDNLSNSCPEPLKRIAAITGTEPVFIRGDIRDKKLLDDILQGYNISAVIHFAGLKAVGESVQHPLRYYDNNVNGTINLCQAMAEAGVHKLVFSSSATVYGDSTRMPLSEDSPLGLATNPYGQTKSMIEQILMDLAASDKRWSIALLRYFNPIGAHSSGQIGEDPNGIPNNLLPYISQVAIGKLAEVSVFGNDYPTADGTEVRDYIHVTDLALGHLAALDYLRGSNGIHVWNLGTGQGHSVLEIIAAFARVSGRAIPYTIRPRRPGDVAACWANPDKAKLELGWQAKRSLEQMLADTWRWQQANQDKLAVPSAGSTQS